MGEAKRRGTAECSIREALSKAVEDAECSIRETLANVRPD